MSVVVPKRQEFFVALLQGLEPCQPFIDRDSSHRSTLGAALEWPTTTMASSSKRCQAVPRRFVRHLNTFVVHAFDIRTSRTGSLRSDTRT
jgi:hypothetical protein